MEKQKGAAKLVWIIVIVVVVVLLAWWMFGGNNGSESLENVVEEIQDEEAASIAADLEGLNEVDLEAEFADIEADLDQL